MNYSSHFVGHFDLNPSLIKDIRKLLRLSGFRLWVRGGNPNRKQHTGVRVTTPGGFSYTRSHNDLRRSMPLSLSTYGRFYVRRCFVKTSTLNTLSEKQAKSVALMVVAWYEKKGINVKSNVPTTL